MRIVQITAGTGSYHCDTCLRDHAMVRALRSLGHDVMLVPLYLPLVPEMPEEQDTPLFLGGINAYLQQKVPLFRHTPGWLDKLFDAQWLLKTAAGFSDMTQPRDLGEMTISTIKGFDGNQRKEMHKLIDWLKLQPPADLYCLSNALLMGFAKPLREAFNTPILCTLQGADYFIDNLPAPYRSRCWELLRDLVPYATGFVAVSEFYAGVMSERMAIPSEKLHVIRNGIDIADFAGYEPQPEMATIGYFSQMTPVKGLAELIDAFLVLRRRNSIPDLRLRIGGSIVPAWRRFVHEQESKLAAAGAADCCTFEEILDRPRKLSFLSRCTVFSVPTQFAEPFGIYAIEAMAMGIPVAEPHRGAFPELIELTGCGECYDPASPHGLADTLERLLADPDRRRVMSAKGRAEVQRRFSAMRMATDLLAIDLHAHGQRPTTVSQG